MKNFTKKINFVLVAISLIAVCSLNAQNILTNGGFESIPPTTMGNNIGHSVSPWTLGSGNSSNVVRVDGPGGYDYSNAGPQSDASGVTNGNRHYLDIANGRNDFYQSFTPQCSGTVTAGGFFSTRANRTGTGSIEIRQGIGLNGTVVGQSVPVTLSGGNSKLDAWTPVSTQVSIQANQTYSFIVSMDNNMNFDEGYAEYDTYCPPDGGGNPPESLSTCCPPIAKETLVDMFVPTFVGSANGPYKMLFKPSRTELNNFNNSMQAYADLLGHTCGARSLNFTWQLCEMGTGNQPISGYCNNALEQNYTHFSVNNNGSMITNGSAFFNNPGALCQPNTWYRITVGIYPNDNLDCFDIKECSNDLLFDFRWQFINNGRGKTPAIEIKGSGSKRIVAKGKSKR